MLKPDFLQFKPRLRLTRSGDTTLIFDPIRKKELVLTPEELLRQLVLLYLLEEKKYPANRIRVEIGIEVNSLKKRCDLVVFDAEVRPWLLLECKSPSLPVNQAVFEQAARYNMQLKAPFLAVTNGLATYCCALDFENQTFKYLEGFPDF